MCTRLFTRPHGIAVIGLLLTGGCVNLTPPWENVKDAAARTGGTIAGGNTGTIEDSAGGELATGGSPAGGANDDDAPGAGGAAGGSQIDSNQILEAGGKGGALDSAGTLGSGGTLDSNSTVGTGAAAATDGAATGGTIGTGGIPGSGGTTAGGAGGTVATGGSTAPPDAKPPVDQAPKNDTTSGPEVDSQPDAGVDAPADAPPGPDLPTDPAPAVSTAGLVAYYTCDQTTGTTLLDSSGLGHDATLSGATSFAAGQVGNGLVLTAINPVGVDAASSGGYASLPPGIVAGATAMTVTAWFRVTTTLSFQRVFDFGTSTATSSMYFTPYNANGLPQFSARFLPEAGAEIKQDLIATAIAIDAWHFVAVVLDGTGGHLYLDNSAAVSSATMTLKPSNMGAMPNNWIGRSEFTVNPYFDGMIDEFRIYTRALTPAEIAILATR